MAPYTNMPDDVKAMAEETAGQDHVRRARTRSPARSPSRTAREWLKDGEVADDGALLGMNFYVEGVDDKLPQ